MTENMLQNACLKCFLTCWVLLGW